MIVNSAKEVVFSPISVSLWTWLFSCEECYATRTDLWKDVALAREECIKI